MWHRCLMDMGELHAETGMVMKKQIEHCQVYKNAFYNNQINWKKLR